MSEEVLRILMVEDQEADAILIQRELRRQGLAVTVRRVDNDAALIRALAEFTPDLVLSDYALPGFSGLEALAILRKERPGVPLIFVSGTVGEEQAVELLKMGATDYVLKDNLSRLPVAINRALRERQLEREHGQAEKYYREILAKMDWQASPGRDAMGGAGQVPVAVAHELNNILAPIPMAASMLRGGLPDAERERMLTIIESSAKRASEIVRAALAQGRSGEWQRHPLEMDRIIKEVFRKLPQTWPETLRVKLHVEDDLWPVTGDAAQIGQVIFDLCMHAGGAMPGGGTLRIGVVNQAVAARDAVLPTGVGPGAFVVVEVSDTSRTGQGTEAASQAFDPFFAVRAGGGGGEGLAAVPGVVKRHGGFVRADAVPGEGNVVKVFLPATVPAKAPRADTAGCILLVDDEETIRFAAKAVLTKSGYRVLTATDGADALKVFREHAAEIALVLTDVMMPVMDGPTLIRAVRQIRPDVRIIASSGQNEKTQLADLRAAGADTVLDKPYAADILLRTVGQALGDPA